MRSEMANLMRGRNATGLSLIKYCPSVLRSSSGILRMPRTISMMLPTQALLTLVSPDPGNFVTYGS